MHRCQSHNFHEDCLTQWMSYQAKYCSKEGCKCPVCKTPFSLNVFCRLAGENKSILSRLSSFYRQDLLNKLDFAASNNDHSTFHSLSATSEKILSYWDKKELFLKLSTDCPQFLLKEYFSHPCPSLPKKAWKTLLKCCFMKSKFDEYLWIYSFQLRKLTLQEQIQYGILLLKIPKRTGTVICTLMQIMRDNSDFTDHIAYWIFPALLVKGNLCAFDLQFFINYDRYSAEIMFESCLRFCLFYNMKNRLRSVFFIRPPTVSYNLISNILSGSKWRWKFCSHIDSFYETPISWRFRCFWTFVKEDWKPI